MTSDDEMSGFQQLEDETLQLLRASGVSPRDLDLTPDELTRTDAAAATALSRIVSTPAAADSVSGRARRRVGRMLAVAAVAAMLACAVVIVRPWGGTEAALAQTPAMLHFQYVKDGNVPTTGKPARAALEVLAVRAERQPEPGPGPIQRITLDGWWSTIGEGTDSSPAPSVVIPHRVQQYLLPDGKMRSVTRTGAPLDETGRLTEPLDADSDGPSTYDELFDSEQDPNRPLTLPTDPAALRAQMIDEEAECAEFSGACLFEEAGALHGTFVLPSAVNAAIWRVMADDTSITYLGRTRDRLDREAIAFTAPSRKSQFQLIIFASPDTGAWLGNETILIAPGSGIDLTPPAVLEMTALVEAKRVTAAELPPGKPTSFD